MEIREMISFELGKEIEKDVFSSCHERGTKEKNSESPCEIEPQTFEFRAPMLHHWTVRLHGEQGSLRSSYDTCPAYCYVVNYYKFFVWRKLSVGRFYFSIR